MKKLTIGIPTYNDYDGLYFTLQSIRMYHSEILNDIEFIIIDNNPTSNHGKKNEELTKWVKEPIQYIKYEENRGTAAAKNQVFKYANTPYVMCIDSHIMIQPKSLKKLINYFDNGKDEGNLIQGPLVYDDFISISTHFDLVWRGDMWGVWATDQRGINIESPPFEIPAQGMGLFSCRKDSWLEFSPLFKGFGGEEGYIHEKYRKHGKKVMCLPFLRWMHRFERPNGVPYTLTLDEKVRNYYIGFSELGKDTKEITEHFKDRYDPEVLKKLHKDSLREVIAYYSKNEFTRRTK